jgi:MFS family permease
MPVGADAVSGRRRSLLVVLLLAVLVGGVAQAWAWRLDVPVVPAILNTQFAWASLLYAAGWVTGRTRAAHGAIAGALAGALTGCVLIGSYYLFQAVADGQGSAADQFTDSRGVAWVVATIGVGAVLGALGSWAALTRERPRLAAFSLLTMALFLMAGPTGLVVFLAQASVDRLAVVVIYGLLGAALAAFALRRTGRRPALVGGAGAVLAVLAGVVVLVVLLRTVLYVTF